MAGNSLIAGRSLARHIEIADLGTYPPCKAYRHVSLNQKTTFKRGEGARVWIIFEVLHDLTVNLAQEFAIGESFHEFPTCLFEP
jgi:hypothetical protein